MTKSRIFLILSLSFLIGIAVASLWYPRLIATETIYLAVIAMLIGLAVSYKNKRLALFISAVLFFLFGIFLTEKRLQVIVGIVPLENFSGRVKVIKEPQIKDRRQNLIIRPENKKHQDEKFLISTDAYEKYSYGDILEVDCNLKIPENFSEDFDYRMYLAKDKIFYLCDKAQIEKTGENKGNLIYTEILLVKNIFERKIYENLPAPESGLLVGLILGGSNQLSDEMQDNFSRTGLTHIVAVSGYNVTIIVNYLMLLGIFLGFWRRQAFWLAVIGVILFVIIVGAPASATRAGVMGILLAWAMKNGRLANSQNAVLFAAAVMLLFNPTLLRWDVGFQLSFLATLGIIHIYPILEKISWRKILWKVYAWIRFRGQDERLEAILAGEKKSFSAGRPGLIMETLLLTLSAQIFVLPIILYNFGQLSLISPLANILVLPIIPLAMFLGFLAVLLSFALPFLSQFLVWPVYLPLKYETAMVNFLADIKYASVEARLGWWGVVLWYIILITVVYFFEKRKNKFFKVTEE